MISGYFITPLLLVVAIIWMVRRRNNSRRQQRLLLALAADILEGDLRTSRLDPGRVKVQFPSDGHLFSLFPERRRLGLRLSTYSVVELEAGRYQGPGLEICSRTVASRHMRSDWRPVMLNSPGLAEFVAHVEPGGPETTNTLLHDPAIIQALAYPLDRKRGRLHMEESGCWFECAGFPDNEELIASIAQAAAAVMNIFLAMGKAP